MPKSNIFIFSTIKSDKFRFENPLSFSLRIRGVTQYLYGNNCGGNLWRGNLLAMTLFTNCHDLIIVTRSHPHSCHYRGPKQNETERISCPKIMRIIKKSTRQKGCAQCHLNNSKAGRVVLLRRRFLVARQAKLDCLDEVAF